MTKEKTDTTKTITFRPSADVKQMMDIAVELTGANRSQLINDCLRQGLHSTIDDQANRRLQALEQLKALQSRPTPDQTAKKMAKKASAEIKKKRKR
jgi:uncharacterized protein (DUF1778 family)